MKKFLFLLLLLELILLVAFALAPNFAWAQTEEPVNLFNPLGWINVERPGDLVVVAFQSFAGVIAMIAVAFTVFSGFKMVIASNEESINSAKESLKWSVGGFIVAILAFTLVSGTAGFLGFDPGLVGIGNDTLGPILRGPEDPGDFVSVTAFIMQNFLGIVGFATTLMIIYYGYRYLTSAGNEESIEKAKSGLKWAILGLVVTLLAFTIISGIRLLFLSGPPAT